MILNAEAMRKLQQHTTPLTCQHKGFCGKVVGDGFAHHDAPGGPWWKQAADGCDIQFKVGGRWTHLPANLHRRAICQHRIPAGVVHGNRVRA